MAEPDKKCILLVEDDPTISDLVAYNLRRAGYDVVQEHNGRAGLQTALARSVDLVLMDLMLPGLDGMAASREIVRRKPALPIIMLTARSERETILEGFELGADDYITKPFDLDVLLARIQARLRRAPAGIAVGAGTPSRPWRRESPHRRSDPRPRRPYRTWPPGRGDPQSQGARPARAPAVPPRTPVPPRGDRGAGLAPALRTRVAQPGRSYPPPARQARASRSGRRVADGARRRLPARPVTDDAGQTASRP